MDKKQERFIMRYARRVKPQHKHSPDHVVIRKDSLKLIIKEAYDMGKQDAQKGLMSQWLEKHS